MNELCGSLSWNNYNELFGSVLRRAAKDDVATHVIETAAVEIQNKYSMALLHFYIYYPDYR